VSKPGQRVPAPASAGASAADTGTSSKSGLDVAAAGAAGYTVVARRYRPQRFEDVVGQDHIVQALRNALRMNRVTHAYLFSGTRGVGKTSMARIFAKCLNCVHGPTAEPCLECDICRMVAVGQDVDVIEIDGASNNGVEAVRELRQNAGLRPSRARFKIYYIDEVHMLSTGAFNALLKTLEEPPEHLKFFFATTEPNKIPITVLSRCQRYDFAGIAPEAIVGALESICRREGIEVEPEALRTVARRASGSLRDAQSLLEQLLAAGAERLTVERVHSLLGTASDERVLDLLDALADRDPGRALRLLDEAAGAGIQPTELLGGLLEFLRDAMVLSAGSGTASGAEIPLMAATPRQRPRLQALAGRWPLDTVLAALQVLDTTRARLRGSPHGRLLVEMAFVRVARLENLRELSDVIARLTALEAGAPPAPAAGPPSPSSVEKKKVAASRPEPAPTQTKMPMPAQSQAADRVAVDPVPAPAAESRGLDEEMVRRAWPELIRKVGVRLGVPLSRVAPEGIAVSGPGLLVIGVGAGYNWVVDECEVPEARGRIEKELGKLLNQAVTVRFTRSEEPGRADTAAPAAENADAPAQAVRRPGDVNVNADPMVRKVVQLFEARPVHLEVEDETTP
jgi:DNA polymerase-3 subunit gamma/tau